VVDRTPEDKDLRCPLYGFGTPSPSFYLALTSEAFELLDSFLMLNEKLIV